MKVLIVVDMQNDFIDGALGTKEAVKIVPNVKKKIEEYEKNGDDIIFTQDTHFDFYLLTQEGKKLPIPHCIQGTDGWQIADELNKNNHIIVKKHSFGYEHWSDFNLDIASEIEIIGLCTDICVISNALILRASFHQIPIKVDASCCAGTTPELHKAALEVMKSCQIDIIEDEPIILYEDCDYVLGWIPGEERVYNCKDCYRYDICKKSKERDLVREGGISSTGR